MALPTTLKRMILSGGIMGAYRAPKVLPATATETIFKLSGPILLMGLMGYVTTVCSGTATTLKISLNPDNSAAQDLTSAVAITSDALGTVWSVIATIGGALDVADVGASLNHCGVAAGNAGIFLTPGIITITSSATNTGGAAWSIFYIPSAPIGQLAVQAA